MLDYIHRWLGQRTGIKTADLDTSTIHALLEYMRDGGPVSLEDELSLECVRDRLLLELDIRAWGLMV